ncbi:MAG: signal peptide peptidase SppA [Planctomycetes bacterium]|nr:signal peptide peptidase SppA [Planctomycetota bacterium]
MTDAGSPPPSGSPQQPPRAPYHAPIPPRESKPVSFYLAIFLALLLFVSGGLNLLLLVVSAFDTAAGGFGGYSEEGDGMYEIVAVGGDADAKDRILRVPIVGAIAESSAPLIGAAGGTVSQVKRALATAARDDSIRGILFDVNSPGGGVTDSDELHRLITQFRLQHKKPVVALFGDVAASGGYYMSAACDYIMARPTTITGSIGVIMQTFNVAELAKRYGVRQVTIVSEHTPHKDLLSMMKEVDPEERAILTSIVEEMYERFVKIVDEGRPALDRDAVRRLADGRIYSAQQALDNGLVDSIGSLDDAYDRLEKLCGLDSARVVEQRRRPTLGDVLFGARAQPGGLERAANDLLGSVSGPRFLYYWTGAR